MNKRLKCISALFFAAMVTLTSVVGVAAKTSTVVDNTFQTGGVHISLESDKTDKSHLLPGQTVMHTQSVINDGADCYIRAKLQCDKNNIIDNINMCSDWALYDDGYYYYKPMVENKSKTDIYDSFVVSPDVSNDLKNSDVTLCVDVDAIQSANFSPDYDAKYPWGTVDVRACNDTGKYSISSVESVSPFVITYSDNARDLAVNASDFFVNFNALMPGDIYTDSITFVNNSNHEVVIDFKQDNTNDSLLNKIDLKITNRDKTIFTGKLGTGADFSILKVPVNSNQTVDFEVSVPKDMNNDFAFKNGMVKWYFTAGDYINTATPDTSEPDVTVNRPLGFITTGSTICISALIVIAIASIIGIYLTKRGNKYEE